MSAQPNPNPPANPANPTAPKPDVTQPDSETQKMYRDTTILIRDMFFPHYSLYQKTMLQEKIKCYDNHGQTPDQYFKCIDGIDDLMRKNANTLQTKFGSVDVTDRQCQDSCKQTFHDNREQYVQCALKCAKNMREGCIAVYNQFYDSILAKNPEYKKIKK